MHYLVCYDITNNSLRKKIADRLLYYGLARVQLSVFVGYVADIHFEQMTAELNQKIEDSQDENDSIIFLRINHANLRKMIIFGKLKGESDYIFANGHTIYI